MSTAQQFHRFRDLPRELQIHIWELYESTQPHHRHYFRRMMVWSGRLYACADQYTNRRVSNTARAGDPDQTRVPDAAVAPKTKILLSSWGSSSLDYQHWVSEDWFSSAESFSYMQAPVAMDSPAYIFANFKNDTFCFVQNPGYHNGGGSQNLLQYFQGATGLSLLTSGSQLPLTSHWFFQIQRLVLVKTAANQTLGPLDRQLLGMHTSLRRVTIVAVLNNFSCSHLTPRTQRDPAVSMAIERLPLKRFLALRQIVTRSCACEQPVRRLGELEQLRQDLVELFQHRTAAAPRVHVDIEVEVHWNRLESLVSGTTLAVSES